MPKVFKEVGGGGRDGGGGAPTIRMIIGALILLPFGLLAVAFGGLVLWVLLTGG